MLGAIAGAYLVFVAVVATLGTTVRLMRYVGFRRAIARAVDTLDHPSAKEAFAALVKNPIGRSELIASVSATVLFDIALAVTLTQ